MENNQSEIVINPDGSVYHLKVTHADIADDIILVGDPVRARLIAGMFNKTHRHIENREFITLTGDYKGKRISVVATGIGVDNIDIILNELHIAANYDARQRCFTGNRTLNLLRIGTSGALQPDIEPGSVVLTEYAIGIDGLFGYYADTRKVLDLEKQQLFVKATGWPPDLPTPYISGCSFSLANRFDMADHKGMTITAPGFYAPQGRYAALMPAYPDLNRRMAAFTCQQLRVLNFEMESSALYALGRSLGHKTLTLCLVLANREQGTFLSDYQKPMQDLIERILFIVAKR